ncbi:MAG: hypothetical protein QXM73_02250 [Candidatus Nezhaarchaeales archaeon]
MLKYAYGACQSSWRPTFYGITDDEDKAEKLINELTDFLRRHGEGDVFITGGGTRV